jgi:peptidoglycan/LPS O-acetylase OafA/YrhL
MTGWRDAREPTDGQCQRRSVSERQSRVAGARNRTLDGIRGIAALAVFVCHCFQYNDVAIPFHPATYAVWTFFILSGCVLTPTYRGSYIGFLAKRFVRLWPLYAVCVAAGVLLSGVTPPWTRWLWWPMLNANAPDAIDPPAWSLHVEWWAMVFMPLIVLARRGLVAMVVLAAACLPLMLTVSPWFFFGVFFVFGAWVSQFDIRARWLESPVTEWLGTISYPLYLSHAIVIEDLGLPIWAAVPVTILVAQLLTWTVERWSISASRLVGRFRWPDVLARTQSQFSL